MFWHYLWPTVFVLLMCFGAFSIGFIRWHSSARIVFTETQRRWLIVQGLKLYGACAILYATAVLCFHSAGLGILACAVWAFICGMAHIQFPLAEKNELD